MSEASAFTKISATDASAEEIASKNKMDSRDALKVEIPQAVHRIHILNSFHIKPGARVLEIGCGQGTCTTVLAHYVGPDGHVDAVDPASLDYGSPWSLGQAQEHLMKGELGPRITFWNREVEAFLKETEEKGLRWDCVVFVHSIWYFLGEHVLKRMLAALKGRADRVCIAEYAMAAHHEAAVPHVLAAMTRATLEAHDENSEANIRCLLAPADIKRVAQEAGWSMEEETSWVPEERLQDGGWEVGDVKSAGFLKEVESKVKDQRVRTTLRAGREAVLRAIEGLDGKKVRTMDVWGARFVLEA